MISVVVLIEPKMYPIPKRVTVVVNWGHVDLVNQDGKIIASGDHMLLKGDQEDFVRWLARFNGVYIGKGPPIEQHFKYLQVAEELRNTFQTPKITIKEGKC